MTAAPFCPRRAPVDAYGNGGFRFAEMSHRGSLLCLADGIHGWDVSDVADLGPDAMSSLIARLPPLTFLLLGTGRRQVFPPPEIRQAFFDAGLGLDPMDTGAACRTYNVLLAEGRPVGAALIAVD